MKWLNKGHEFDEIGKNFMGKETLYLYGAGLLGERLLKLFDKIKVLQNEVVFIDRDVDKQKCGYYGKRVISPDAFFQEEKENKLVIITASQKNTPDIEKLLLKGGYQKEITYFTYERFVNYYLPIYLLYAHDILYVSSQNIIPSTVCNLNCEACLNFTPYIKKHVIDDVNMVKKDVDSYFEVVDYIERLQISGGEPLLYDGLEELIAHIGRYYREKIFNFEVVTNGTIIPKESLLKILKKYNVLVYLDDYRCALPDGQQKYEAVKKLFIENEVCFVENTVDTWIDLKPYETNNGGMSKEELEKYFNRCAVPWSTIRGGKITSCNYAHYAAKAGIVADFESEYFCFEGLDRSKRKEFLEFRMGYSEKGYCNFCKRCAGWTSINPYCVEVAKQVERKQ